MVVIYHGRWVYGAREDEMFYRNVVTGYVSILAGDYTYYTEEEGTRQSWPNTARDEVFHYPQVHHQVPKRYQRLDAMRRIADQLYDDMPLVANETYHIEYVLVWIQGGQDQWCCLCGTFPLAVRKLPADFSVIENVERDPYWDDKYTTTIQYKPTVGARLQDPRTYDLVVNIVTHKSADTDLSLGVLEKINPSRSKCTQAPGV